MNLIQSSLNACYIDLWSHIPSMGMASGVGGIVSVTVSRKTTRAKRMVVSRLTFSPDSTGRKKPRKEMVKIKRQGKMRLST